ITGEVSAPNSFASVEQTLPNLLAHRPRRRQLLFHRLLMKPRIAAVLDPLAILLRVEIRDAQYAMKRTIRRIRINIGDDADKRRIAFEDHVELAHLVALHTVRALRIDLVPVH